jgi:cytochrome c oxidase accessory protein FixG
MNISQEIDPRDRTVYRDKISTVDSSGKRVRLFPKKPKGKFYNARTIFSIFLLLFLFIGPFLKINGHPFLLFNILERKFYLFGITFWPQDLHLFGIGLITLIVFIVLFTAVFGRLFCGWACPQSVLMEMVFRRIDFWIEGNEKSQMKLSDSPWNFNKIFKRSIKYTIYFLIAFLIGNTFLAYIIGIDELLNIISDPISEHITGFTAMVIFSTLTFANFAFFREQACTLVCPYGRLQGVLLDDKSIVVHYDFGRGEPRGKGKRIESTKFGDCIDCYYCVDVCPTGIDIRNGTQLECINCTACIDACNSIMDKVKLPRGLIRYASFSKISGEIKKGLNIRVIGYTAFFVLISGILVTMLLGRKPIESTILRTPGSLYQIVLEGYVSNLYNIKVVNKSFEKHMISLELHQPESGQIRMVKEIALIPDDYAESAFFIDIPIEDIHSSKIPIRLSVLSNGESLENINTTFIAPLRVEE